MKIIINTEAIQDKSISYAKLADDVARSITAEIADSAPETLDTLNELAAALGDDPNFATTIVTELSNKADTSGYYPKLKVGTANDLSGRNDVTEGFIGFRESAGAGNSIEDGTANVQELLGESLVWNQQCRLYSPQPITKNGLTFTINSDSGSVIVSGTAEADTIQSFGQSSYIIKSHTYILTGCPQGGGSDTYNLFDQWSATDSGNGIRFTPSYESGERAIVIQVKAGVTLDNVVFTPRLTDITLMFGAGNEPTTVEEFEAIKNQLVGVDFTAYNAGEVLGVNIKGIKSVNDNAWDEEWKIGYINNDGSVVNGEVVISKNYIRVLPSTEYTINKTTELGNSALYCYDHNKNYIGLTENIELGDAYRVVKTLPNTCYVMFRMTKAYGATYNNDICIRLAHSGYKTDYVAHEESKSSFDLTPYFPNGMHGINGVRDSVTKSKATRRFGMVDLGSLSYAVVSTAYGGTRFVASNEGWKIPTTSSTKANLLCKKYLLITADDVYLENVGIGISANTGQLSIYDPSYTDGASFKAAMQGVMLYYELATPIETEIDPQLNMNYKVWDFGTEELLTDSKSAPVLARTIYGFNATDTIRGNKAKIEDHEERISDLENEVVRVGDYQPDLSVGVADNLAGTDYTESEIGFRRSGGGAILDGNARVSSVKGNSVVWNQVVKPTTNSKEANGVHIISQGDGSFKVYTDDAGATAETSISSINIYLLPNHKYAVFGTPQQSGSVQYYIWWTGLAASENGGGLIKTYSGSGDASYWSMVIKAGTVIPQSSPVVFRPRAIDLTLMFGAGNEPTTIEEFYARKPKVADENAYNEGEVIHMDADAIKSVGVNQWDEEWEVGVFLDTGAVYAKEGYENAIHTKNYIPVIVGQQYYFNHPNSGVTYVCEYDANKNFIRRVTLDAQKKHTIPTGVSYVRFSTYSNYGTTYKNDICINLSDTEVNGKYFPYVKREQTLDMLKKYFPNGMKSAGTAHDEIRYNKTTQKWEAIKRIGEVDMGTLNWVRSLATDRYNFNVQIQGILPATSATYTSNILQSKYAFDRESGTTTQEDKTIRRWSSSIYIRDDAYTDVTTFKAAMSGVILIYELAEPIVTEIDENFNLDYEVWNAGTEQMIADTPSTPIKASIAYGFNAVGKIKQLEEIIAQLQTAIANLSNS